MSKAADQGAFSRVGRFKPGASCVVLCPGMSLDGYDDSIPPRGWPRVAVEDAVLRVPEVDVLVLSDATAIRAFSGPGRPETVVVCPPGDATLARSLPARGRVEPLSCSAGQLAGDWVPEVAGIDLAVQLGAERVYVFGLDLFRTRKRCGFSEARPHRMAQRVLGRRIVKERHGGERIYVNPFFRRVRRALDNVITSGRWDFVEVWCVGSPLSQQDAIPPLTIEEFKALADEGRKEAAAQPGQSTVVAFATGRRPRGRKERLDVVEEESP